MNEAKIDTLIANNDIDGLKEYIDTLLDEAYEDGYEDGYDDGKFDENSN